MEQRHLCCSFVTAKMHRNGSVCRSYKYSALESRHLRKYFPPTPLCVQPQRHENTSVFETRQLFAIKERQRDEFFCANDSIISLKELNGRKIIIRA